MSEFEPKQQPEVNKGYIMIVDKDGKVVDMPMRSTEASLLTLLEPQMLDDIEQFWSEKYPEHTIVIK